MRVINKANANISKLWNTKKAEDTYYRLFSYVIMADVDGGKLLQNIVTGELIFLNKGEAKKLLKLPSIYAPWMDELIEKHFLVKVEANDKKMVDGLRSAVKILNTKNNITGYTILPTTDCNARCFYCYEAGYKPAHMSKETADKLVEFMDLHRGDEKIHISWFGGEPLVGIQQINYICANLKKKNVPFVSTMVSNGYLINEEVAARAVEDWKLKKVQITIDGTKEIYNKTKAYVNACDNPYEKILENIGFLLKNKIQVSIRMNLGMHNYDDLNRLIDELGNRFEDKTFLSAYIEILFDNCGFEPTHFNAEETDFLFEKKEALKAKIKINKMNTTDNKLPRLIANRCMSDSNNTLVVTPTGMFSKCEHFVESNFIGNLDSGITNLEEVKNYAEKVVLPECELCPMYPACIRLKVCEIGTCSKKVVQEKIGDVVCAMKAHYENRRKNET